METKKLYAVAVYDDTCNDMAHEFGIYGKGDYSWIDESLNGGCNAEYNMTLEEAEEVKADFERVIKENNLEWASVDIDCFECTYDVEFNNDENTDSKGWHCSYEECENYIRQYNGTNESYFEDYKGGTVSIRCNETEEIVFETEIPRQ